MSDLGPFRLSHLVSDSLFGSGDHTYLRKSRHGVAPWKSEIFYRTNYNIRGFPTPDADERNEFIGSRCTYPDKLFITNYY